MAATVPPPQPGHVRRTARMFWRAGEYDFPGRGLFRMGPADNRRAVETFQPVQFDYAHKAGPLDGKLGQVVALFPAQADFSELGYHADVPEWLDRLHRDEDGNPLPLNVSATWGWSTKDLRRVALVNEPRIADAAMFERSLCEACFEATGDPAVGLALGRATDIDDDALDMGRMTTLVVSGDEEALESIRDLAMRMGCTVEDGPDAPTNPEGRGTTPSGNDEEDEMAAATQAAFEARLAALERENRTQAARIAANEKAEKARRVRDSEARFAQLKQSAREAGVAFANELVRADKVHPYQRGTVLAEFMQAALDDARHPEEVHFSAEAADGTFQKKKGTRLDALRARYQASPKLHMLGELLPDRAEAEFDVPSGHNPARANPTTVHKILAGCDLGRVALARLAARNTANGNGHTRN